MFPEAHLLGVDLVIPDFDYLHALGDRFAGFVLTHGHEDHIGALPYALRDLDVPLYATEFTAGLIASKGDDHPSIASARIERYTEGEPFRIGDFEIEGIPVTHSIIEACSLAVRSPAGTLIHSGDFKIDPHPIDGRAFGADRLRELGDEGVRVLLSDSTNVVQSGTSGSESNVAGYLRPAFEATPGRIVVTTFASHVHRISAVIELAAEFGRRVVPMGRSMDNVIGLARRTGHLSVGPDRFVDAKTARNMTDSELCYLVTGSQGEPRSALTRIATGESRDVKLGPADAVVFSSKVIPGNERAIGSIIDELYRGDVTVYEPRSMPLHVSGHGYRDELKTYLELVRPEHFVPVHGQIRNLVDHARLAVETGVDPAKVHRIENGDVLEIDGAVGDVAGTVSTGRVLVDGSVVGGVDDEVLRDRRNISRDGVVFVVVAVSHRTGEVVNGPEIFARGLASDKDDEEHVLDGAVRAANEQLEAMSEGARRDLDELAEELRIVVRRHLRRNLGSRPVVVPHVLEL